MKKLNLLFTALLLVCCIGTAMAEEVTIDGIKYDVVTKAKLATVIKSNYSGDIVIPETVEHNGVICSVTSICGNAFRRCGLTSIVIPNSVTSIGYGAFSLCSGLTSVEIPNSVTSIEDYAFDGCTRLKEVHISDLAAWCGIDFYGGSANPLYYAKNLYLNGELVTELVIPEGVKEIKKYAFNECSGLTSVVIPNSVTTIGEYAFQSCDYLREVHISDIAAWCRIYFASDANPLYYAKNLYLNGELVTELVIPDGVTEIKERAFSYCTGLTSVEIPNSVTSIGQYAFFYCTGLTSITIPNSVTSIGKKAFSECNGLTSVVIGNSVTSIGSEAFYGCNGLTSVVIGNGVTSIGDAAFRDCSGLTSVEIPNSVTSIGVLAFDGCGGLTNVTIGSGVKNIYSVAFGKCENLTDVYCLATSVPSTSATAFEESHPEYMTLHVPAEAINSYKTTAPWSSFGTIVTLDGDVAETPKCANPVIKYNNGKIEIECETEGAEFMTTVTNSYTGNYYSNNFELSATYDICVYAMATGYENSETVNATLCWIECDCDADDTGIINIPAKAALVTSNNGVLFISCQLDGAEVAVYTTDGVLIATTAIENGAATVTTGLSKGDIAIVRIGNKSIKVIVD